MSARMVFRGFLDGLAEIARGMAMVSLWPDMHREDFSARPQRSDAEALAGDWRAVGRDLQKAIRDFEDARRQNGA